MAERDQGISFDALFGGFSDVQTQPAELIVTAEMAPTTTPAMEPVYTQPPTQGPKYPQYARDYELEPTPQSAKPHITIPEVQPLLPGQTNYRLVTKADGTRCIEDHDIGEYPFLRDLMKTKRRYLDQPTSANAPEAVVPRFVTQANPVMPVAATERYVAPPKSKKSFSEHYNSFKNNMSRAARISRMAGAMTVAGVVLVGSYKVGGGPALQEDGLLSVPKNVVLNLNMAVTDPGRTMSAQLTRIHLRKPW